MTSEKEKHATAHEAQNAYPATKDIIRNSNMLEQNPKLKALEPIIGKFLQLPDEIEDLRSFNQELKAAFQVSGKK